MALDRKQRKRIYKVLSVGRKKGASRQQLLSAIVTHRTESNYGNPPGGHGTSKGWRQQISGAGEKSRNRTNIRRQAGYYFDEARGKKGTPGQISHAVQRSAYPGKASDPGVNAEAKKILAAFEKGKLYKGGKAGGKSGPSYSKTTKTTTTPGVDNSALRTELKGAYLAQRGHPDALLNLAAGLGEAKDVPGKTSTRVVREKGKGGSDARSPEAPNSANRMERIAHKISKKKVPYQWGGGHGAKPAKWGSPVDCSGFVAQVLGVSPRVSGQFAKSFKPGRGKRVTVYANDGHVLMKINGKWYGTSKSNPGGGPGRIKPPSAAYLAAFRARHPKGL